MTDVVAVDESMTKDDLLEQATARNLDMPSSATKADIIAAIEKADAAVANVGDANGDVASVPQPVDSGTLESMQRMIDELKAMNARLQEPTVIETPTDPKDIARTLTDHLEGADNPDRFSVHVLVELVRNLADAVAGTERGRTEAEAKREKEEAA